MNNNNTISSSSKTVLSEKSKMDQILSYIPFLFKKNKKVVAVIRLEGIIGKTASKMGTAGLTISGINKQIERAFKLNNLAAICLSVNSPGGSPVQSELIANRIISLSQETDIPVISFVEDVAASGGYWLACAGDEIYVSKSSIVGSIGVISSGFGFTGAIEKLGIERRIYTEGKNKSVLDPFMPAKKSDIELIKKLQKNIHAHFVEFIKSRRGRNITQDDEIVFNGEFWTGKTAVDFGLADGIDDMYNYFTNKFGDEVKFEYIEQKSSFLKRYFGVGTAILSDQLVDSMLAKLEEKALSAKFDIKS